MKEDGKEEEAATVSGPHRITVGTIEAISE